MRTLISIIFHNFRFILLFFKIDNNQIRIFIILKLLQQEKLCKLSKMIINKKWGTFNSRLNRKSFIVSYLFFIYLVSAVSCEHESKNSLEPIQELIIANENQSTSFEIKELKWNHPLLAVFFISLSLVTVSGNILVICAVIREPCLKTATNYYIISLAVADLLVGCVVAPFNGLSQMTFGYWFFGQFW